ncbi:alpha/beta fold hydrolase [Dongia rigui]|uniref:Alpha/beta fold hydrolase n=1 Tax=Dongia rigui TaxID=940149 RepID=A0ABU5E018_9PROT|nr:alpha/beta fold hydrolase [Dongia rigui]MDY0872927.1 alpha/beta fold hydrolase [Dongia rigui]
MRAQINGTELFITVSGQEDRPALILGHSLATSHEMWGLQATLFARHFRVVNFDMRGHGASAVPGGAYTIDQLADDVIGVADHLRLKRFHFAGLSIGGLIGQSLGYRHGDRLEKLILSSTFTGINGPDAVKLWTDRAAAVRASGPEGQADGTMSRWLSAEFQKANPQTAQWIRDLITSTPANGYAGCADAIRDMNLSAEKLAAIKVPTLVIAGEKDPGATPAEAAKIAAAIPNAKAFVMPGGYHLCNVETPHLFNETVLAFLLGGKNG